MKKPILIWAGTLLLLLFCFLQQAQAQNNGGGNNGGGNNGGGNCSTSQPSEITGPYDPCPGETVTYCISANPEYTSYVWDVPRAQAGEAPTGWVIISGGNTACVTVKVGEKPGTMKVTVQHNSCSTKERTMPVHPGKMASVEVSGPGQYCPGDRLTYSADIDKQNPGNGNGGNNKSFAFNWTVPAGWTIESGAGTEKIVVIAGVTPGAVSVNAVNSSTSGNNGNGNNTGGNPNNGNSDNNQSEKRYCGNASDTMPVVLNPSCVAPCPTPTVSLFGPSEFCNLSETATVFRVANPQEGVTYTFTLPEEGFIIDSEKSSNGFVAFRAEISDENRLEQTFTISVTAKNSCGKTSTSQANFRVTDCGSGTPECLEPTLTLTAPDTVCNINAFTLNIGKKQADVTYDFTLPEGFIIEPGSEVDADGNITIVVATEEIPTEPQTITVTATNECGSTTASATVVVSECDDNANPLPVSLTKFEGSFAKGGVTLVWETATEINNDRFEIERSANGTDFIKIGEVKGGGNSLVTLNYTFTDKQPLAGTMYYRLRQVDFDGAFEYSKVVAIDSKAVAVSGSNFRVSLFPNPAVGADVNVRFDELPQNADQIMVRVVDMNGRILHTKTIGAGTVDPNLGLQSIGLRKGVYMISLSTAGQSTMQRLVIQ